MAITIPIVTEFKDAGLAKAERELQGFSGRIEKRLGNVGMAAIGAGTAIGGFAVKAVMDFKDLALESGRLADATGLAVDEASRWIEVSGDLNIASSDIQTALLRMNKSIGEGGEAFKELGIEITRTESGLVDSNKTFQDAVTAVGAIEDPTLRAKAAQEIFGKSYANIARLMEMSAKDLQEALASVSDQQVVSPEERIRAEKLDAALKDLKEQAETLSLTLGEALVPAFTFAAEAANGFLDKLRELRQDDFWGPFLRSLPEWLNWYKEEFKDTFGIESEELLIDHADAFTSVGEAMDMIESRVSEADYSRLARELGMVETSVDGVKEAFDRLTGRIDERKTWKDFDTTMFYFRNTLDMSQEQADEFALALGEIIMNLEGMPDETKIRLLTQLDRRDFNYVDTQLRLYKLGVDIPIRTRMFEADKFRLKPPGLATGGIAKANQPYMVGERGPELFVPTGTGRVIPNDQVGGSGMTVNITTSADPNEVIRAIEYYRRRNGTSVI
jgi:hypothetical protein